MDVGDKVFTVGTWLESHTGKPEAYIFPVVLVSLDPAGPMVEHENGERRRIWPSVSTLAATEAEAKAIAADRLDRLAQPIIDKANALRAEAAALLAAEEVAVT